MVWGIFLLGLPVLFAIDQSARNTTGESLNLITTVFFGLFLLSFLVAILIFGMQIQGLWRRIGLVVTEVFVAVVYLYCISFWSLTLPGADTL